ncbi:MAG: hypothetical protein R2706_09745 [Acidimicrobiales bacterium]
MTLTWTPDAGSTDNQASATSTGVISGDASSDLSTNGANPDPDGNGTPDEEGVTKVTPPFKAVVAGAEVGR